MKQQAEIEKQGKRLNSLTIEIKDTEKFIETVAEAAFDKAAEVYTEKVREETRKTDLKLVEAIKKDFMSEKNKSDVKSKKIAGQVLDHVIKKFHELADRIANTVTHALQSPEKKEEIKAPIKRKIQDVIAEAKVEADKRNAARMQEQQRKPKRKSYDMSL